MQREKTENLVALRRIEGQVRGIHRMVEEDKYCVDILVQIQAVINALHAVAEKIFRQHLETCVVEAFRGESEEEKRRKIDEIIEVLRRVYRL